MESHAGIGVNTEYADTRNNAPEVIDLAGRSQTDQNYGVQIIPFRNEAIMIERCENIFTYFRISTGTKIDYVLGAYTLIVKGCLH